MRRRLLLSTLAVAVVAVLLLGIPLAYSTHRLIYDEAEQQVEREAATVLAGVYLRQESHQSVTGDQIAREFPGRYIMVTLTDNSDLQPVATEAKQRLEKALAALAA